MSLEELKDSLVPEIAWVKSLFIKTVDNRISQNISNTLDIDHDHISSGNLPREVAQCLSDKSFVRAWIRHPTTVIVLFDVVTLDIIFSIEILEFIIFHVRTLILVEPVLILLVIKNFENKWSDKVSQEIWLGNGVNDSLIKLIDNQIANGNQLEILAHVFNIILIEIYLFHALKDQVLIEDGVIPLISISVSSFAECIAINFDLWLHSTGLDHWVLPIDHLTFRILNDIKVMSFHDHGTLNIKWVFFYHLFFCLSCNFRVHLHHIGIFNFLAHVEDSLLVFQTTDFIFQIDMSFRKLSSRFFCKTV